MLIEFLVKVELNIKHIALIKVVIFAHPNKDELLGTPKIVDNIDHKENISATLRSSHGEMLRRLNDLSAPILINLRLSLEKPVVVCTSFYS
jgi:hypothetical protein